ncbi:MAG: PQQ-binding-like beta-propeller repeat protein [Spirochaetia bacterium]
MRSRPRAWVLLLPLALIACGKPAPSSTAGSAPQAPAPAPAPQNPAAPQGPAPASAPEKPAPAPASLPVQVVYTSGDVQGQRQGAWADLEIGAKLGKGDSVKVGDSSECQLKFADMAVVSVRENTQVSIDSLVLSQSASQVKLGLKSGTVLSKVKKLAGGDSYAVRTDTAVGGVRGTEFGVTVTPQGGTLVAVKEGAVAVLPAAYDPDTVRAMTTGSPGLEQIAQDIESSAPAVHAGQEITITPEQAAKAEVAFQAVQAAAAQIAQQQVQASSQGASSSAAPQASATAALAERSQAVQAATATLASIVGTPRTITPVHDQALKPLDTLPAPNIPVSGLSSSAPMAAPPTAPPVNPTPVRISISATPADSEIDMNGSSVGTGAYSADVNPGSSLTLVIRHEGYATKTIAVTVRGPAAYPVELEPMPVEASFAEGSEPLVGAVQSSGDVLVAADRQGQLIGTDRQGTVLWKVATQNTPNENSFPVIGADNLYFTGPKEFLVVAIRTGAVISRVSLDSGTTHLFGQRVAVSSSLGVYPTSTSLAVFDPATGATVRQIPLVEGTLMSPTISDGRVLAVSQTGVLFVMDPESGKELFQVPTGASQPVASAVLVSGSRAFFADRKGLLVCVDLDAHKVLWKVRLKGPGSSGVFQDLEKSSRGVLAFAGNTIYGFSVSDGSALFPPISGASTPPLYRMGRLYFGTQRGILAEADEGTGKILKSLDLKAVANTRPQADGPRVLVGTTTGQVFVIYPDSIQ